MKDNIYLVIREKDNVVVSIMMNKLDHTYSFVILTKGHISLVNLIQLKML